MDRLLIAGIDPGTTTGIALFDFDGNFVLTESRKHFSRRDILRFLSAHGRPVIIASDINPAPKSIERIAASFSARLIFPEKSFLREEKHRIAKQFAKYYFNREGPWKNRHERDALVAALRAFKSVRSTIAKIDQRLAKHQMREFRGMAQEKVFLGRGSVADMVREIKAATVSEKEKEHLETPSQKRRDGQRR